MLALRYHYYPRLYRRRNRPRKTGTHHQAVSRSQSGCRAQTLSCCAPLVGMGAEGDEENTGNSKSSTEDKEVVFPARRGQCRSGAVYRDFGGVGLGWRRPLPRGWVHCPGSRSACGDEQMETAGEPSLMRKEGEPAVTWHRLIFNWGIQGRTWYGENSRWSLERGRMEGAEFQVRAFNWPLCAPTPSFAAVSPLSYMNQEGKS